MQKGDNFIRYSKHGVVRGTIDRIKITHQFDLKNQVKIERKKIITTNGIEYDYEDCYKVLEELKPGFCQRIKLFLAKMKRKKNTEI